MDRKALAPSEFSGAEGGLSTQASVVTEDVDRVLDIGGDLRSLEAS